MRRKSVRTRGKVPLSKYFQEFKEGDTISVVKERAVHSSFPARLQGRTGTVKGKRGKTFVVCVKDQEKEKTFLIHAIHLKKIQTLSNTQ